VSEAVAAPERRVERAAKRILVATEAPTYRAVASRVLSDAGYQVTASTDGARALRLLQDDGWGCDLLLLELHPPQVSGLDLMRRARELPRLAAMRILVVSESLGAHLSRVLSELRLDARLSRNHALRELIYQVDALLFPGADDQRRAPRRLLHLPVNYWVGAELHLESCFDLSEEGMFVVVADEAPPAVGTRLQLRFWLPTSDRLIACAGDVMWLNVAAGDLRTSHPPGMGVCFAGIDAGDVALIRQFVARAS
jgi:CheY-like chemotaxis protein